MMLTMTPVGMTSVRQNPSADNPFRAKNKKIVFVLDKSGLKFENYLVTINNWTTKIQMTKLPLDSLLKDVYEDEVEDAQITSKNKQCICKNYIVI